MQDLPAQKVPGGNFFLVTPFVRYQPPRPWRYRKLLYNCVITIRLGKLLYNWENCCTIGGGSQDLPAQVPGGDFFLVTPSSSTSPPRLRETVYLNDHVTNLIHWYGFQPESCAEIRAKRTPMAVQKSVQGYFTCKKTHPTRTLP